MSLSRLVAITGCDSGLGWAIAARAAREGLVTVAGVFGGCDSPAARDLAKLNALPVPLDVTNTDSVASFGQSVRKLLTDNPSYRLYAVVNNAGVMTMGDYEWNTSSIIENTIDVNLLGTMRVVSNLLPDLRRTAKEGKIRPRVVNVCSHCAIQPLPGLAAYCASKAGVMYFTRALRMELLPYGVNAVVYIPGGFVGQSNILAQQAVNGKIMLEGLDDEQRSVYGRRLEALIKYLDQGSSHNSRVLKDQAIIDTFMEALTSDYPKQLYKVEPWRYKLYHSLFSLKLPEKLHNFFVKKFLSFPTE